MTNLNQDTSPDESNWLDEDEQDVYFPSNSEKNSSNSQPVKLKSYRFRAETIALVESAFLASTTSLIWLIGYYFRLSLFLKMLYPLPIALVYLRRGKRAAIVTTIVSGLLLAILMGPPRSIVFVIPYGLMGIQLGALWQRKSNWYFSILIATIIGCFGFFFRFWLFSILLGEDLWVYIISQVTNLADWIFLKLGILAIPNTTIIQSLAFIVILIDNIMYAFTVHLVALLMLDRLDNPIPRPPKWIQVILDYE